LSPTRSTCPLVPIPPASGSSVIRKTACYPSLAGGAEEVVRDLDGGVIADQRVQHVETISGGLIAHIDIRQEPTSKMADGDREPMRARRTESERSGREWT
jgi:hypothetical protein